MDSAKVQLCNSNDKKSVVVQPQQSASGFGSVCWLNMISNSQMEQIEGAVADMNSAEPPLPPPPNAKTNGNGLPETFVPPAPGSETNPNNCCVRGVQKLVSVIKWVFEDFQLRHLVWIKFIFLFQSASMTVLYPFLNLHMKSLGLSILEVAIINAVIPVLFIFTPPLAGFLSDRIGNFRVLLSVLTALGGFGALLLLLIPAGRDTAPYPSKLQWGISCGRPDNRARFQKLMLHGFKRDECVLKDSVIDVMDNVTFTPATCGYMCPTSAKFAELGKLNPYFAEYKVIWPNRGGGFGIAEIMDVSLDTPEARAYHEPDVIDNNIFFPMNWTFYLSCGRIRPQECIFSPITRAPTNEGYSIKLTQVTSPFRSPEFGPSFDLLSITPPSSHVPVTTPINCGPKEVEAQVVSTMGFGDKNVDKKDLVETRFPKCRLHCLVNIKRNVLCNNTHEGVIHDPSLTFWTYLSVRTGLGVLTAASLMMFEGAVMATIQEMGGDYGIQRFVGNFGAIVFAPLGGYVIDQASTETSIDFSPAVYIYLVLKLIAAVMIMMIRLDFKPPGERILANVREIVGNAEIVAFLGMMMFAGTFWGYVETFLFWYLDDMGASRFLMGWTVAVGMLTSLPFLIFSGPLTDIIGHMNVIALGMFAYFARMLGYSFVTDPVYIYPFEALEGLTMALMMTSAVTYVAHISTQHTIASVMGIMGALFFGVGKGAGSLFGGILMHYVGSRVTFRYFAVNAVICAVTYLMFEYCYVKPKKQPKDVETKRRDQEAGVGAPPQQQMTETTPKIVQIQSVTVPNRQYAQNISRNVSTTSISQVSPDVQKSNGVMHSAVSSEDVTDSSIAQTGPRSITAGTRV